MLKNYKQILPLLTYIQTNLYCLFYSSCDDSCVYCNDLGYCALYNGVYDELFSITNDKGDCLKFIEASWLFHEKRGCESCCYLDTMSPSNGCHLIDFMAKLCCTNHKEDKL